MAVKMLLSHCWLGSRKRIRPVKISASKFLGMAVSVSGWVAPLLTSENKDMKEFQPVSEDKNDSRSRIKGRRLSDQI